MSQNDMPAPGSDPSSLPPTYPGIASVGDCVGGTPYFVAPLGIPMLSIDGGGDLELFCPRCRAPLHREEDACPHVLFIYSPDGTEFLVVAPHVKAAVGMLLARIRASENDDGDTDLNPVEELLKHWRSPTAFCLQVTYSGVACGPMSDTIFIGVELCPPG